MKVVDLINKYGSAVASLLPSLGVDVLANGNVFFVDSGNSNALDATDGVHGESLEYPLATVGYAIDLCTASQGDIIVLAPGHNEGYGTGAGFDADVAGITILGLGYGSLRPTFDFDHAAAKCVVGANNVKIKNVIFRPSITAVAIGLDVETGVTGTVLEDVEFCIGEDGAGADEFIKALHLTSGNHDTVLKNVKILAHASAAQATHAIHVDAASDRLVLKNVVIDGPYATAGILEDAAGVNHVVEDCAVDTTGTNYSFHASSTFAKRTGNFDAGESEDLAGAGVIGSELVITSSVVSSGIPNNSQTGGAITGAASGSLLLTEVTFNTDGTGLAAPTNIELSTDNAKGLNSAAKPIFVEVIASFGANLTVSSKDATSHALPILLESGKKIYIHGDNAAGTGAGVASVTMTFKRVTANATIAAANIAGA